jgi:aryl-alcohol dehydrogenase-like predicted oxidoreductase
VSLHQDFHLSLSLSLSLSLFCFLLFTRRFLLDPRSFLPPAWRCRDYSTPVDEIMRGLHRHVLSGEILYPAVSDTPAWIVASANAYARQHGYSPFVLYQGLWNVSVRDVEREILRECLRRYTSS